VSYWDEFNDYDSDESEGDYDEEIDSDFDDWDPEQWDDIADEYYDLDVFEWFSELS
jgi:hypothetical protein